MTVTHGMNVAEVQALGQLLLQSADRLVAVAGDVDRLVGAAGWLGDDAGAFVQVWATHKGRALAVAEAIRGFGQSALNNASEQLETSDDRGGYVPLPDPCRVPGDEGSANPFDPAAIRDVLTGSDVRAMLDHLIELANMLGVDSSELEAFLADIDLGAEVGTHLAESRYFDAALSAAERLAEDLQGRGWEQRSPETYLAGLAIDIWADVFREGRQLDWAEIEAGFYAGLQDMPGTEDWAEFGREFFDTAPGVIGDIVGDVTDGATDVVEDISDPIADLIYDNLVE